MDGRSLDDGVVGRDKPVETFGLPQFPNRTAACADARDKVQLRLQLCHLKRRSKRLYFPLVYTNPGIQIAQRATKQNHTHIDKFASVNVRNNADERVIIGVQSGHGSPPLQMRLKRQGGWSDN